MARTRSIKPDFFLDDDLDRLSEIHQKLFVGLWCLADAEGRLFDAPKKIKAQTFPYRDYDVDGLLDDLHNEGFIARYEAAELECIAILKFGKHQRPHPKEPVLGLPNPPLEFVSREKKRQEIVSREEPESIPSRPGLASSLVLGAGSLVLGADVLKAQPQHSQPRISLRAVKKPTKPRAQWDIHDVEEWAQCLRQDQEGLPPEDRIPIGEMEQLFRPIWEFVGGDMELVCAGFLRFGEDRHWESEGFPFRAFLKQWKQFIRRDRANVA